MCYKWIYQIIYFDKSEFYSKGATYLRYILKTASFIYASVSMRLQLEQHHRKGRDSGACKSFNRGVGIANSVTEGYTNNSTGM